MVDDENGSIERDAAGERYYATEGAGGVRSNNRFAAVATVLVALVVAAAWWFVAGTERPPHAIPIDDLEVADGELEVIWRDTEVCVVPVEPKVEIDPTVDPVTVTVLAVEAPVGEPGCGQELPPVRTMTVTLPEEARGRTLVDGSCGIAAYAGTPKCRRTWQG